MLTKWFANNLADCLVLKPKYLHRFSRSKSYPLLSFSITLIKYPSLSSLPLPPSLSLSLFSYYFFHSHKQTQTLTPFGLLSLFNATFSSLPRLMILKACFCHTFLLYDLMTSRENYLTLKSEIKLCF